VDSRIQKLFNVVQLAYEVINGKYIIIIIIIINIIISVSLHFRGFYALHTGITTK